MKKTSIGCVFAGSFLLCANSVYADAPAQQGEFVLVSDGKSTVQIVVDSAEANGPVLFAAQELQKYVEKMSGAKLAIVHERSGQPAVVVTTRATDGFDASQRLPVDTEHYMLRVTAQGIDLAGATPPAVLFAAYDLLERLGCGWCVPGDDTVPRRDTLALSYMTVDTRPEFQYRMMLDFPVQTIAQSMAIVDWIAKNRLNWVHPCPNAFGEPKVWYERRDKVVPEIKKRGLHVIFGGHTMHTWLPQEHFKEHPEWFAYNKGERKAPMLCLSNRGIIPTVVGNMRKFLDRCPEVDVIDLWQPDENAFCHCPVCTHGLVPESANGVTPAGIPKDAVQIAYVITYFEFINQVAAELAKSHPKVWLSPLIYMCSDRAMPDAIPPLADNVFPGLTHISRDSYRPLTGEPKSAINMRFLGNDLTWMAKSKHHYIYEYYNSWIPPFIYPGSSIIVRDLQILKEVGAQGSSSDMYGYSPINMYVAARAMWTPSISWEVVSRDFNARFYGDVGPQMADNWVHLEKGGYGTTGYQSSTATEKTPIKGSIGEFLNNERAGQIAFLERMIATTKDPQVKTRLQRDLRPWKEWNEKPRFWAYPPFVDPK